MRYRGVCAPQQRFIRPMTIARRTLLTTFAATLASCGGTAKRGVVRGGLDVRRLADGFAPLAARAKPGVFNLGVLDFHDLTQWSADPIGRYPMQSVFKAPLAAAALELVDAGGMALSERIHLTDADLSVSASRINDAWPNPPEGRTMDLPAVDLIALAVQISDNTAADTLMRRLGGPAAVTAWLAAKGIADLRIDRYEREIQVQIAGMDVFRPAWKDDTVFHTARTGVPAPAREAAMTAYLADPRDTVTAPAALDFLHKLATGALLSPASTRLLLRLMTHTETGAYRLKAGLPPGARLAHKTGTAGTDLGLTPATNDIGVVTLADGRHVAVAAFLAGSVATETDRESLIADAARLVFDCYVK